MKGDRLASIELYRCLLMFGIVLMHCVSQGQIVLLAPYRLLMACLTGFVFISGYFGVRCSFGKVCHLVLTTFVCSAIGVYSCRILGWETESSLWKYFVTGNWFIWAYIVLMAIAPVFDMALAHSSEGKGFGWAIPLVIVVFGWNFLSGMPFIGEFLPRPVGFGTHTFLMMMGVYLAARLFKIFNVENMLKGWHLCFLVSVSGLLCAAGLGHYDSPASFVFVASFFCVFRKIAIPSIVAKIVLAISPSMLCVYLLHWSPLGLHILRKLESSGGGFVTALLTAIILYTLSLALDVPRRVVFSKL